jgi:hypothetical protein
VLLFALLALTATLWGTASYVSPDVLALAGAVAGCWLLVFAVRERAAGTGHRAGREG